MKKKRPILSIGMIVKNEIGTIERCLRSLQPLRDALACELVIADTGSSDGTREIAEQYADVLFDFPWINDFAAARNAVMDHSSGEWFCSIDADEYLDEDISQLLSFFRDPNLRKKAAYAMVYGRSYIQANSKDVYNDIVTLRFVRMNTHIRYQGAIHETWMQDTSLGETYLLNKVFIHHTGYAYPSVEARNRKLKRNMELLEEEVRSNPDDLRRIVQCQESSYTPEQGLRYARLALEVMRRNLPDNEVWEPVAWRNMIRVACDSNLPEFDEWVTAAMEKYRTSIYMKVDVMFFQMEKANRDKDYERVLRSKNAYWAGVDDYKAGHFDSLELCRSGLFTIDRNCQNRVVTLEMAALCALKRWDELKSRLDDLIGQEYQAMRDKEILRSLVAAWNQTDLSGQMERYYAVLTEDRESKPERWKQFTDAAMVYLVAHSDQSFETPYPLFTPLDCDVGRVARILTSETADESETAMAEIEDWRCIPFRAIATYMRWRRPIPDGFYRLSIEHIHGIANQFTALPEEKENAPELIHQWCAQVPMGTAPLERVWRYDILLCAIQDIDWKGLDKESGLSCEGMLDYFARQTEGFMRWYYNPVLLEGEGPTALPSLHRWALSYLKYRDEVSQGRYDRAVAILREMLHLVPNLSAAVDYLLTEVEKRQKMNASSELLALADQVKKALSQYKPDDPAVRQLLERPEYQTLLPLLGKEYVDLYGTTAVQSKKEGHE